MSTDPRRAAVLGKPVAHSLSPVLHGAAYEALGLTGWTYERVEMDADGLPAFVGGLTDEWVGLSVTMPGKRSALAVASEATERARIVGAANTLTRLPSGGWRADCTDVDGVAQALRIAGSPTGGSGVVLGAGGTAQAAVVAFAELGFSDVVVVARDRGRAADTVAAAEAAGLTATVELWSTVDFNALADGASALVSTVPPDAVAPHAEQLAAAGCVLDVIYHPWPTPLATAVLARGRRVATGLDMLMHQAFGQVEQFTGRPAPREAMREALRAATGTELPLPLG